MGIIAYADSIENIDVVPSGLFLDKLSGIGGIPRGRITEVFGDEGIGKSSLCLQFVAAAQRQGLRCLWADVEWSYEPKYASLLGVDNSKLGLMREKYAEAYLDELEKAVESEKWDVVILDSVGGILPRAEAEKSADEKAVASQAGLMARFSRKIVPTLALTNTALVVINHSFTDLMSGKLMTSGGKKLAYHKSLSIRLKPKYGNAVLKQGDNKVGKVVVGEVKKNKLASTEGMEMEGQLIFGQGFSIAADLLMDAVEAGVITKKGKTYHLLDKKLGIGLSNVRKTLETDLILQQQIKDEMSKLQSNRES